MPFAPSLLAAEPTEPGRPPVPMRPPMFAEPPTAPPMLCASSLSTGLPTPVAPPSLTFTMDASVVRDVFIPTVHEPRAMMGDAITGCEPRWHGNAEKLLDSTLHTAFR